MSTLQNTPERKAISTRLPISLISQQQTTTPNITDKNKHKKTKNSQKQNKNAYLSPQTSPSPHLNRTIDTRQWSNLGGNVLQRIRNLPQTPEWQPSTILPLSPPSTDPFTQLLQQLDLTIIPSYCQGNTATTLRLFRAPDIHITNKDLRDIISHNTPIYHESLILMLELISHQYDSCYLDPSFIPTLSTLGWEAVKNRFTTQHTYRVDKPSLDHHSIAIPVHVNGFHWASICRRQLNGTTCFFYADDLNSPTIEHNLKRLLMKGTCPELCPPTAQWINCTTPNFLPHSLECGPRSMLAMAVMITHPAPHKDMLLQYISPNLAQNSRHWMSYTLLTGMITLLPPSRSINQQPFP